MLRDFQCTHGAGDAECRSNWEEKNAQIEREKIKHQTARVFWDGFGCSSLARVTARKDTHTVRHDWIASQFRCKFDYSMSVQAAVGGLACLRIGSNH